MHISIVLNTCKRSYLWTIKSCVGFASIDPQVITSRSETVLRILLKLPDYINALDGEKQREEYEQEARSFDGLSRVSCIRRCFDWWIQVSTKYPLVFKIVTAILSNFLRPQG